jgi:hypothetical protein
MNRTPTDQITVAIATDTATICIYDLSALRHRVTDVGDWWSIPRNELQELNLRNAAILNLGSDGTYEVSVRPLLAKTDVRISLGAPSGKVFIGTGEEISGGGFEPTGQWGGFFLDIAPGDYEVSIARDGAHLTISLVQAVPRPNAFADLIRL